MNQVEAADALGCSVATVSRIRSGDRSPSISLIKRIRDVLSWGVEAQVEAISRGSYSAEFSRRMDQRRVRRRMRRPRRAIVE